jgi:hypothetical protein
MFVEALFIDEAVMGEAKHFGKNNTCKMTI